MAFSDGSSARLAFVPEVTEGTTPNNPTFQTLRMVSESLNGNYNTEVSNEIRADGNVTDQALVSQSFGGAIVAEMSYRTYDVGEAQLDIDLPELTSFDPQVREQLAIMEEKTKSISVTTQGDLQEIIDEALRQGWSVDRTAQEISTKFDQYKSSRSKMIAQTNITGAFGAGQLASFQRAGLRKRWLTQRDGKVRTTHRNAENQEQDASVPFRVGQALLQFPGDPNTDVPSEIFNCRCSMLPVSPS